MKNLLNLLYLATFILISLSACSGGNIDFPDVTINAPALPPQTSEAITARGVITGLGDLTINDVHYSSSGATIWANGELVTLSDLQRGQIVTVSGRINGNGWSGTAQTIRFEANLVGPVASLDAATGRMVVLGQTVMTDPDTLFGAGIDPATYSGLSVGDRVQISGFADADGANHARRVDTLSTGTDLQLIGKVASLDVANLLFTVNGLNVDYSNAVYIQLPGGAPSDGMMIEVNGAMAGGIFMAERLVAAPGLTGSAGQRVQTAGMITRFNSSSDFDIDGTSAAVGPGAAYTNGHAVDLGLNTELVIDGEFAANGRIVANRITLGPLVSEATTVVFDLRDFTEISVPTVFNLTVRQGPDYSVEVTVDQDVANRINVTQSGARLNIALLPGDNQIATLHAYVTLPELNRIDLTGVVNASLNDFNQPQMTVNIDGVSRLQGNALTIGSLTANVSGVSQLNFGNTRPIGSANINLSGVSLATLNMDVGATLTGSVATGQGTGTSALFYYGTDINMNVTTDNASAVIRLGDTRS